MNTPLDRLEIDNKRQFWFVGITVTSLLFLTWLYLHADHLSPESHGEYSHELQKLQTSDAEVDGEILAASMELSRNYDALTRNLLRTMATVSRLVTPPPYLPDGDQVEVRKHAEALQSTLEIKADLIDLVKRNQSVLRNSLAYFQKRSNDLLNHASEPANHRLIEEYVRRMMFYVQIPDQAHRSLVEDALQSLSEAPSDLLNQRAVNNLILHGDTISKHLPLVHGLIREIITLPTAPQLEKLTDVYQFGQTNAEQMANQYRALLYVIAILLTGYLAFTFVRLERVRRSLTRAHQEVTQHYEAQKRAERLLRLHDIAFKSAHEGITLTDPEGNIIAVNPAFSRITGYEEEEAIGCNPRVLKSGRHDSDFYRAMWKSIKDTGNWRGEIWNRSKYGEVYPELLSITAVNNSKGELTNYVAVFNDISRIKEQESQLQHMAYYDALTDLPNRVLLADRMNQAMSHTRSTETCMAICYVDLDGFKPINDQYGHDTGDHLLIELADRFKSNLRGGDTVARMGGDEFVFLLLGLSEKEEFQLAAQRLMDVISKPIMIGDAPANLSASIGITLYPYDENDGDTLLRHADQAMYQAKQMGKNCYHLFDADQDSLIRIGHQHVSEVEKALQNEELRLYYQPKVDLWTGQVIGMEALIRWQHPKRGLILPGEFLPAIEEHDLTVRLGQWVIDTALGQIEQWIKVGIYIPVSVNVASRQLQQPNFVEDLKELLAAHPLIDAGNLELEVLETAALEDIATVSRVIDECMELGVSFALDDFGTGYSSLTYLKRLPASILKIDRSFVGDMLKDPENLAIVRGILGLANSFQREAIAEGVETVAHGRLLMQLGCRYAQGYGIARPMPVEEVQDWVGKWTPPSEWESISHLYWEESDYPLLAAKVEHRRWVALLVHAVKSRQPIPHIYLSDHMNCRFGKWYYHQGEQRYGMRTAFQDIEAPHLRVHELAELLDNKLFDVEVLLPDLIEMHEEVIEKIEVLEMDIAVSLNQ